MEAVGINWNTILGALGPSGILIWYVWYTQTVSFPRQSQQHADETKAMTEAHQKTLDAMSQRFHATLERIVSDFRQDLKEERLARAEEIAAIRDSFRCNGPQT